MTSTTSDDEPQDRDFLTPAQLDELGISYELPEETPCNFCGKPREMRAIRFMRHMMWVPMECGCEQEKAFIRAEEAKKLEEEKKRYALSLRDVGILPRYQNAVLDDADAAVYLANFDNNPGEGLYIRGICGSGKTSLACAIAQKLHDAKRRVLVTTAIDMLGEVQETFDDNSSTNKAIEKFITCDLLVIDDLGKESAGDWSVRTIFRILNARYGEMRSTIITSEYEPAALGRRMDRHGFGDPAMAILSRLNETCKRIERPKIDYREVPGGYFAAKNTDRTQ